MEDRQGRVGPGQGPGKESAAVAAADGGLYFRYQDGIMALIAAKPDGYAEKGHSSFRTSTTRAGRTQSSTMAGSTSVTGTR